MADRSRKIIEIPPYQCASSKLITARSHFIDRFVPACEIIALPEKEVKGGHIGWQRGPVSYACTQKSKIKQLLVRHEAKTLSEDDGVLIDLRFKVPENWAHFLNNHLSFVFFVCEQEGLRPADCLLILPQDIPNYIQAAAKVFGFPVLCTDAPVTGHGITLETKPWQGLRAVRADWIAASQAGAVLQEARSCAKNDLPKRFFLSRQDSRKLENEAEIETYLAGRGFVKLYAEDLSAIDQFRLFLDAECLVGVHGAGLAPLLFCSGPAGPRHLIELLPCGHMTDVYRVMSQQIGCKWIGVRGKIKPEHVEPAYVLDAPFKQYSLQSFEVDIQSLQLAFEML